MSTYNSCISHNTTTPALLFLVVPQDRTLQPSSGTLMSSTPPQLLDAFPALEFGDRPGCPGQPLKVIAISLYGASTRYTVGAVRNSEIAKEVFPEWELWVYVPDATADPALQVGGGC